MEGYMSTTLEFEGKSVEKAVKAASKKLNIPESKLKHDVISYGSSGIFGLVGTKKAKIRVVVPESKKSNKKEPAPEPAIDSPESAVFLVDETFGKEEPDDSQDASPDDSKDKAVTLGQEVLQRLIESITTDATIAVEKKSDKICYNVSGGNTALLIGKRGQTLEAIQYLIEKIVNKQNGKRIRLEVDIEGYLNNKREKLENLARKLGEKAKRTKKPVTVGQLNSHDRRIVHIALKEDSELRTHSIGEGYYRKLKIFPKNRSRKKPRPQPNQ